MARIKRHTAEEIGAKLAQANKLASDGMLQTEIAKALGVSVMTFHRWRKQQPLENVESAARDLRRDLRSADREELARIGQIQDENARLRRLVTDLLLEKLTLEEELAHRAGVKKVGHTL